ncbi:hypothetical protein [Halalkalibacterium ligniniphilum]|uniref:hypothetical protein n=1 Tax=Halalkalibacterium ligniniphilum TaxID=1134413 RepID=UPI000347BB13|nr:hypothetical protein [Halalkalibacterium ligniniphilum]
MIEFYLALDDASQNDHVVTIQSIPFVYDKKAEEEIGAYLKIDAVPSQGLKLVNQNQTLAYNQKVRPLSL